MKHWYSLILLLFIFACSSKKNVPTVVSEVESDSLVISEIKKVKPIDSLKINTELATILKDSNKIVIDGITLKVPHLVTRTYSESNYLIWEDDSLRSEVILLLGESWKQGLTPEDYFYTKIYTLNETINKYEEGEEEAIAKLDVLITSSVFHYAFHMLKGKVSPTKLDKSWNYKSRPLPQRGDSVLLHRIHHNTLVRRLNSLEPTVPIYQKYKKWLVKYSDMKSNGDAWESIHYPGKPLRFGDSSETVGILKKRLLNHNAALHHVLDNKFDSTLLETLIDFQKYHGVEEDGIAGKGTFEKLNLSVDDCINTIRVNMERCRWINQDFPENYLLVNIADFHLYLNRKGKREYSSKVVVGKLHHETPVFQSKIRYIEFNPTWTVPRSIATKEILPKLKKEEDYFTPRNMVLLRNGKVIDHTTIDFTKYNEQNFPFVIRQEPGINNALGTMKFIFPNEHFVYLHDTPSKYVFNKVERAFSHGCVRVHNPKKLAEQLIKSQGYTIKKIDQILATEVTTRVNLKDPLQVYIMYWTCYEDRKTQKMFFYKDLYGRDEKVLKALDQ